MYTCPFENCKKEFETKQKLGGHLCAHKRWKNEEVIKKKTIHVTEFFDPETGKYKCPECSRLFSKMGLGNHIWKIHGEGQSHNPNKGFLEGIRNAWNKGLTAETNEILKQKGETWSLNYKSGKIKITTFKHSQSFKDRQSKNMIERHKNGTAWNIGQSRWNNQPSYPETFFMKVIENEFKDKSYIREFGVGRFSIDFAWKHKMKAIEIDGEQHEQEEYKTRDQRKDKFLKEQGWEVLRIKWLDLYHEPKTFIKLAKEFIDNK